MLRQAVAAYYNSGEPIMTDPEFDALKAEHATDRLNNPSDPVWEDTILDQVGAEPPATFEKVSRGTPMLSLSNVFATADACADLDKWRNSLPDGSIVSVEPKIDGLSVELYYKAGELVRALTRGDGVVGSDVTANVRMMESVPKRLNNLFNPCDDSEAERFNFDDLVVRGEIAISHDDFKRINADGLFANPRNAASGAIMSKDPADSRDRRLTFILHTFVSGSGYWVNVSTQDSFLLRASCAGFATVRSYVMMAHAQYKRVRDDALQGFQFPVDGLVAKVSQFDIRRTLGETGTAPRWAIAIKFPQEQKPTLMHGITIQVGRSGVLTPVAELLPVLIDGSTVSRASLHNETHINALGLCVGDTVVVQKAAAIIPEIVRSVTHDENPDRVLHSFSVVNHVGGTCPECGSRDLESVTTDKCTKWYCRNKGCISAVASHVAYWASRQCFDIEGIGGEAAEAWARAYLAGKDAFDKPQYPSGLEAAFRLFGATKEDLAALTWTTEAGGTMTFGVTRAAKAIASLEKAVKKPLRIWIAGAGIPSVGINTSKELSRLFPSARALIADANNPAGLLHQVQASVSDAQLIRDFGVTVSRHVGPVSALAVLEFVKQHGATWQSFMPTLDNGLLDVLSDNFYGDNQPAEGPLSGKSVCVTGTLSVGRTEFQALLESAGARIASGVSKNTDILVAGEAAGSKLDKAGKLGITVMSEDEVRNAIRQHFLS